MKVNKRQLKRIIREEKARLLSENTPAAPGRGAQIDQNLRDYQDGIYGDDYADLDSKMEDAIFTAVEMFIEVNGVSEQEANQMVVDQVKEMLGML